MLVYQRVNGGDPTGNEILQKVVWQPCDGMVSPTMFKHIQNSISKKWSWFWCLPFWTIAKCEHGSKSVTLKISAVRRWHILPMNLWSSTGHLPLQCCSVQIGFCWRLEWGSILESLKLQHDYKHYKPIYIYINRYIIVIIPLIVDPTEKMAGFLKRSHTGLHKLSTGKALLDVRNHPAIHVHVSVWFPQKVEEPQRQRSCWIGHGCMRYAVWRCLKRNRMLRTTC